MNNLKNFLFSSKITLYLIVFFLVILFFGFRLPDIQAIGFPERVSIASDGTQANAGSYSDSISGDGRYIAFYSDASNLVSNDTNNFGDIFVKDRQTGITELVSVASDGTQGNSIADDQDAAVSISADGRYAAFASFASNLVSDDTSHLRDIFVHDRQTGTTERVSIASDGVEANGESRLASTNSISGDGRFITFISVASNLVPGDTNGVQDIFVHDRQTGTTQRVSIASDGSQANDTSDFSSISIDGRYVAFQSIATNLVSGDTNNRQDSFIYDLQTGITERVSVASDGTQGNNESTTPYLSSDGRYVVFDSQASNLVSGDINGKFDTFVRDRQAGTTQIVSIASDGTQGNDHTDAFASISGDGRYVVFNSNATNLVPNDTNNRLDTFVHDLQTGITQRVTVASDGTQQSGGSVAYKPSYLSVTTDGSLISFHSGATNLVPNDTNSARDVFVTSNPPPTPTPTPTPTPVPTPTTLTPLADSYIKQGSQNENEGASTFLRLQQAGKNRALLKFSQSQIQTAIGSSQNYTAKLRLTITDNGNNWGTSGRSIGIYRLTQDWLEGNGFIDGNSPTNKGTGSGTTWNCAIDTNIANSNDDCNGSTAWNMTNSSLWPFVSTPTNTTTITNNQSGIVEFDVTSDIQSFVSGSNQNYGWLLKKTDEVQAGRVNFGSKETLNTPQLIITPQ